MNNSLLQKGMEWIYTNFKKNTAKMLIWTGVAGWGLSSLAQIVAIMINPKISKEQKSFLVPQEFLDQHITSNHDCEQDNRYGARASHLHTNQTIIIQVVNNGMRRVVGTRKAYQAIRYRTNGQGVRNRHNSTEQQLRLHVRKRDVPQLLPSVPDSVDRGRFILRFINALNTGYEREESYAKAGPQGYDDNQDQYRFRIRQP